MFPFDLFTITQVVIKSVFLIPAKCIDGIFGFRVQILVCRYVVLPGQYPGDLFHIRGEEADLCRYIHHAALPVPGRVKPLVGEYLRKQIPHGYTFSIILPAIGIAVDIIHAAAERIVEEELVISPVGLYPIFQMLFQFRVYGRQPVFVLRYRVQLQLGKGKQGRIHTHRVFLRPHGFALAGVFPADKTIRLHQFIEIIKGVQDGQFIRMILGIAGNEAGIPVKYIAAEGCIHKRLWVIRILFAAPHFCFGNRQCLFIHFLS